MANGSLAERISNELLPRVRQPGQYIGNEWNQLVQRGDWEQADLRVVLGFPDTYTIGMSHLGCQILYSLCNHTEGVCAERVYTPWHDAEQVMRDRQIPLFTWDTRQEASSADIFAISIQYEMNFTNMLTLLDLSGIPFRSEDRTNEHPLVLIGGPQVDNPEPIAPFVDLVVIGDGEASMKAIVETCRDMKREGADRRDMILELAKRYDWLYAPSLYTFSHNDDNTISHVGPSDAVPAGFPWRDTIRRCRTPDFENAPFPEKPLVPYVETVHDRIAIEIMRGCPQTCRFCHAGFTKKPLVRRSVDRILELAESAWKATGQREIGLLSLSSGDYPDLRELAERANELFSKRHVNLSLPSLRVDAMLANIPSMVNSVRKSGLTVAVEAAQDDMRQAINKKVTDGNLFDGLKQAYAAGWNGAKLYFMAGFPGEREEDLTGIVHLAREISEVKKRVRGGPASVRASVSWFVPKPHTPMQWAAQKTTEYFNQAQTIMRGELATFRSNVKLKTHTSNRSLLEAVFSRGDRRLAPVIEDAWRNGARMDGWDESFSFERWMTSFEKAGVDPHFYANRERPFEEILPWDHIESRPSREYLQRQYEDIFAKLKSDQGNDQ